MKVTRPTISDKWHLSYRLKAANHAIEVSVRGLASRRPLQPERLRRSLGSVLKLSRSKLSKKIHNHQSRQTNRKRKGRGARCRVRRCLKEEGEEIVDEAQLLPRRGDFASGNLQVCAHRLPEPIGSIRRQMICVQKSLQNWTQLLPRQQSHAPRLRR